MRRFHLPIRSTSQLLILITALLTLLCYGPLSAQQMQTVIMRDGS